MATHQLRRYQKLSQLFKTAQTPEVPTLFWVDINAYSVFRHRSRTLVKLLAKLGTALLIGPAEHCPMSSPVNSENVWASDEGFKIASCIAPRTRYLRFIQIFRVIRLPLFLFKHLRTVLVVKKLEWWGYRAKKDVWRYLQASGYNTQTWRTDRQTDGHRPTAKTALGNNTVRSLVVERHAPRRLCFRLRLSVWLIAWLQYYSKATDQVFLMKCCRMIGHNAIKSFMRITRSNLSYGQKLECRFYFLYLSNYDYSS